MFHLKSRWMPVVLTAAIFLAGGIRPNGQGAGASVDGTVTDQQRGAREWRGRCPPVPTRSS
jgi:hypothetical protein